MDRGLSTAAVVLVLTVLLGVAGFGSVALANGGSPSGTFFDDDGNIHEGGIEAVATVGVTKGCNPPQNTDYCPGATVTRDQMAAFLVRALGLADTDVDFFIDDDGSIFERDINRLANSGITKGCNPPDNTRYCPDSSVTRGQMAAFLVRAFGYTDGGGDDLFIDDDGSVFENDIDKLGTAEVTKGCNPPVNDRYCPTSLVQRDQMASFLTRALNLVPMTPSHDHSSESGERLNLIVRAATAGCDISNPGLQTCALAAGLPDGQAFWVRHGWGSGGADGPGPWSTLTPAEQQAWIDSTRFDLHLNGTKLKTLETLTYNPGPDTMTHSFQFQFPGSLNGTHTLTGEWFEDGSLTDRITATIDTDT